MFVQLTRLFGCKLGSRQSNSSTVTGKHVVCQIGQIFLSYSAKKQCSIANNKNNGNYHLLVVTSLTFDALHG